MKRLFYSRPGLPQALKSRRKKFPGGQREQLGFVNNHDHTNQSVPTSQIPKLRRKNMGQWAQCGFSDGHSGYKAIGGWCFGNTINGAQAEYLLVPHAQANLAKIPDELTDEQVVLLADIASTGFSGAESGNVKIGDSVVVFAQGPIDLCSSIGAKLMGSSLVIGVESDELRLDMARKMGVDVALNRREVDVLAEIKKMTNGGADFGGTLSSLGVYSGKLQIPYDSFAAGLGDHKIVTTLCPGGKELMRRLMEIVKNKRVDLSLLITHRFPLEE